MSGYRTLRQWSTGELQNDRSLGELRFEFKHEPKFVHELYEVEVFVHFLDFYWHEQKQEPELSRVFVRVLS